MNNNIHICKEGGLWCVYVCGELLYADTFCANIKQYVQCVIENKQFITSILRG